MSLDHQGEKTDDENGPAAGKDEGAPDFWYIKHGRLRFVMFPEFRHIRDDKAGECRACVLPHRWRDPLHR